MLWQTAMSRRAMNLGISNMPQIERTCNFFDWPKEEPRVEKQPPLPELRLIQAMEKLDPLVANLLRQLLPVYLVNHGEGP